MRRFFLPLSALFVLLFASRLEAQSDRRGDTIFVADWLVQKLIVRCACD